MNVVFDLRILPFLIAGILDFIVLAIMLGVFSWKENRTLRIVVAITVTKFFLLLVAAFYYKLLLRVL